MSDIVPVESVAEGAVVGAGDYAVGDNGDYFAVSRKCRHLRADLAEGSIDANGCLVCPWHGAKYDVRSGRMVGGPQGVFAKIPGLGATFSHAADGGNFRVLLAATVVMAAMVVTINRLVWRRLYGLAATKFKLES